MKIYGLPKKQNLAHLRVQWFHNEDATRGKSENVLKIKYRTRRGEDQEFLIPVSSNAQRNLRKKVTGVLGKEGADLVMQQYRALNKECKAFFGFRLVRWMEGSKHKSKSDAQTLCWFKIYPDNTVKVSIVWAGEELSVTLQDPKASSNPRAPIGIGYFNAEEDFKQQLARFSNDNNKNAGSPTENDHADEAGVVDIEPVDATGRGSAASEARCENAGSGDVRSDDGLAAVGRDAQAGSLGGEHPVSVACEECRDEAPIELDVGSFTAEPTGCRTVVTRKGKQRRVVDSDPWGVWQPEAIPCTATGLGTDFRIRLDL